MRLTSTDPCRKLYEILGSVVAKLYGQNLDEGLVENRPVPTQDILTIEDRLWNWKRNLSEKLSLRPWLNSGPSSEWSQQQPPYHPVFARLSVVTRLRYLCVRILLHRPILTHLLLERRLPFGESDGDGSVGLTQDMWKSSVVICQDSAMETIDIIHRMSNSTHLLGAWWYTIYFGKFPSWLHSYVENGKSWLG